MAAWPEHEQAACLDCGAVAKVSFPAPAERQKAEAVLNQRKAAANRNWKPWEQSVGDLQAENLLEADLPAGFVGIHVVNRPLGSSELLPEFEPIGNG